MRTDPTMTKMTTFRRRAWLSEMIAPAEYRCLNCGREVFDGLGFCNECKKTVVYNNGKTCKRCGMSIEGAEDYCGNCAFERTYFDRAYSAFCYEGAVRDVILRFKFGGLGNFARVFAKYLAFLVKEAGVEFDVVTYAPMTKKSMKKRGYNQAQLLAKYFCDILECGEKLVDAIVKTKETEPQEQLGKAERKTNLVYAYDCVSDVKGKRVLVIDDVKTTGATLNECGRVLKKAGATCVIGITIASAREKLDYEVDDEG